MAELAGLEPSSIEKKALRLLRDEAAYRRMARPVDVFGDGRAGERIAASIAAFLRHAAVTRA